ncbi:MAG: hypothetical protein IIA49_03555 [Bacteroidetes bacterium]|nr:hypothetical protein [Bacteroidota bacterium]MCH7770079.1 hypothetical protein [Bacteroidota bacterium]
MNENTRERIDLLLEEFWKRGYLTVSRKFGTYLPEPERIGKFDVDIVARHKKDYAIGINLSQTDFADEKLAAKLEYLASRHTKYTNKKVKLFVGIPANYFKQAKIILDKLNTEVQKNIKLFQIVERDLSHTRKQKHKKSLPLFS